MFLLQALGCCEPYPPPTPHAAHRCSADCPWLGWAAARTASTRINIPPKVAIVEGRWAKAAEGDRRALCKGALYLGKKGTECQCQVEIRSTLKTDRAEDTLRQSKYGKISQGTRDAEPSGAHSAREKRGEDERRAGGKARRRLSRGSGGGFSKVDIGALINLPHSLRVQKIGWGENGRVSQEVEQALSEAETIGVGVCTYRYSTSATATIDAAFDQFLVEHPPVALSGDVLNQACLRTCISAIGGGVDVPALALTDTEFYRTRPRPVGPERPKHPHEGEIYG